MPPTLRRRLGKLAALSVLWLFAPLRASAQPPAIVRADSLFTAGSREAARSLLDELVATARAAGDSALLRDALLTRGRQLASVGRAREAAPDLATAEGLARRSGQAPAARNAVRWWAYTQLSLGNHEPAQAAYDRLLAESLAAQDRYHEAQARFGLAYLDLLAGRRREARAGYEHSIRIFRELGQSREEMFVLVGLARVLADDGDVGGARAVYADIVRRSRELQLKQPEAQALNNLAILEFDLGRADRAVANYRAAIALYTEAGEAGEILGASSNLATALYSLGRYDEAEALLDSTLARTEVAGQRDRQVNLLILRCDIARSRGDLALAESCLSRGFAASSGQNVSDRLALLLARARLHSPSPKLASDELERDSASLRSLVGRPEVSGLDLQRARLLYAAGEHEAALALAKDAAQIAASNEAELMRLPALTLAAGAARELGDRSQARALLETALTTWESIRGTPRDPEWRERWGALSRGLAAEFVVQLLDPQMSPSQAEIRATFTVLQRFKARTFVERLTGFGALAGADSLHAQSLQSLATIEELQVMLEPQELLLDLHRSDRDTAVFLLSRQGLELRRLAGDSELEARAARIWELMSRPAEASQSAAIENATRNWAADFLAPLLDADAAYSDVLVAPDQAWHAAPYEAIAEILPWQDRQISRIPSAQVLLQLRTRRRAQATSSTADLPQGLLIASSNAAGLTLQGSVREARSLAGRWSNLRAAIDVPFALAELKSADWLHFASHAEPDPQRPWNSSLRVLQADRSTLELRAYDVLALQLDARLCVLSACESASAQVLPGEGMLGLGSAFLIAGSDAVVAAMWKIDDATTTRFMQSFYAALAEGSTSSQALGAARHTIHSSAATRHPYYWAGFCLIGEPSGHLELRSSPRSPIWIAGGLLLVLTGVVIFRRRRAL